MGGKSGGGGEPGSGAEDLEGGVEQGGGGVGGWLPIGATAADRSVGEADVRRFRPNLEVAVVRAVREEALEGGGGATRSASST